jgi:hypothetical protein
MCNCATSICADARTWQHSTIRGEVLVGMEGGEAVGRGEGSVWRHCARQRMHAAHTFVELTCALAFGNAQSHLHERHLRSDAWLR